ncbi:hypothetical protein WG66_004695 [Moniliophthora roreri]|nr:hypothetical protein WG66_004695 [Moniliophthora roreri]
MPSMSLFFASFTFLLVAHHLLTPVYPSPKQNSWIITTAASLLMTLFALPFLYDFILSGPIAVRPLPMLALAANRFFQAYLLADLAAGVLHYRDQVNLLTGWVHHIVYVGIVEYAVRMGWGNVFCLCAFMELPTFILGLSILAPRTRSNILFAATFFLTRIVFHIVLGIRYSLQPTREAVTGGSFAVAYILGAVFPLHVNWFYGCLKGFVRRARKARELALKEGRGVKKPRIIVSRPALRRRLRSLDERRHAALAQLYLLRGGSMQRIGEYRQRVGEYRQRMRDYRRAVVGRLNDRPTREALFEWVGLGSGETRTRTPATVY